MEFRRYDFLACSKVSLTVWNEPNCCPDAFYTGSMKDYFTLYNATVIAVKSVDSRIRYDEGLSDALN